MTAEESYTFRPRATRIGVPCSKLSLSAKLPLFQSWSVTCFIHNMLSQTGTKHLHSPMYQWSEDCILHNVQSIHCCTCTGGHYLSAI